MAAQTIDAMEEARRRTLALVAPISDRDLVEVHSPLMSPLVWDLGHIAAFEDLWLVHRAGGEAMLREDLGAIYDAFETPRAQRGELAFLTPREARAYLEEVRTVTLSLAHERGVGDGTIHELVLRHEQQHCETMLQTIQLARLEGYTLGAASPSPRAPDGNGRSAPTGLEFLEIPAGTCTIGAPEGGFAYDNERPRHRVELDRYLVARHQVTNGDYRDFISGGGYHRREWWCEEGWAWRTINGVERPGGWDETLSAEWRLGALEPLEPARPVIHVSWFEADAFARAHGARLPTEAEWEKAASWDQAAAEAMPYPWGDRTPVPGRDGNFDQREPGTARAGTHPDGDSPYGVADAAGQVWEWTASTFSGYPGFTAHPYPEYSEVFFGPRFRVLRGGSWATRARVLSASFRNWDFPERRQIFAGIRLAK